MDNQLSFGNVAQREPRIAAAVKAETALLEALITQFGVDPATVLKFEMDQNQPPNLSPDMAALFQGKAVYVYPIDEVQFAHADHTIQEVRAHIGLPAGPTDNVEVQNWGLVYDIAE